MGTAYYILWFVYVISEWRSHSWHYFLIQNSSKFKHTKKHQINIKCIVCNKNNNKLVFNPICGEHIHCFMVKKDSSDIPTQKQLHRQIEHSFVLVIWHCVSVIISHGCLWLVVKRFPANQTLLIGCQHIFKMLKQTCCRCLCDVMT